MLSTVPPRPVPPPFPFPPADPGPRAPLQPPMVYVAPVWEYKHLRRELGADAPLGEDELNALGAQGWELTAVIPTPSAVDIYFKRARE
jgi:hypothetical protein